ncbi:MAG: CYTH domain-containing protein [Nitrospiraceae bacterium]|nr:CYTH domain-containing protein [Nitrospiraceae bacterium]
MAGRNIELKARLRDRDRAIAVCESLGARLEGDIHQVDTYFNVPDGRFKFRASDPGDDYLVFYRRPDVRGIKGCDYVLEAVDRSVRGVLAAALGELAVVEKVRTLYLWHNVRIHLDEVQVLGAFIEFEAVLSDEYDDKDGERKLAHLQEAFGLAPDDHFEQSYLELLRAQAPNA